MFERRHAARAMGPPASAGAFVLLAASLFLLLLGQSPSPAAAVSLDPDKPRFQFWWRSGGEAVVEIGDMDLDLQRMADALGRGEYAQARRLAQALVRSAHEPELRAQAAAFLVQAHLSEGDVDSARVAAERLNDQESLARISRIEAHYKAEVARLRDIAAMASSPAEGAQAQLHTARAQEAAYRFTSAEQSYWEVVRRYPQLPQAAEAIVGFTRLHLARGDREAAMAACEQAVELAPDSPAASGACRAIGTISRLGHDYEDGRHRLGKIADAHPDTWAFHAAHLEIGALYAVEGLLDQAEAEWAMLLSGREWHPLLPEVAGRLSEVRYQIAMGLRDDMRYDLAVGKLRLAVRNAGWERRGAALRDLAELAHASEDYETAKGAYEQMLSLEKDKAQVEWLRYDIARCYQGLGLDRQAAEEFRRLLDEKPTDDALVIECDFRLKLSEDRLRAESRGR